MRKQPTIKGEFAQKVGSEPFRWREITDPEPQTLTHRLLEQP